MNLQILQSTIERLLYIVLLLVFIGQIALYAKITVDDNRKFHILKANQDQILCIVDLGFKKPPVTKADVDACVTNNR